MWCQETDKLARRRGTKESWHGCEDVVDGDASLSEWRKASGLDFTVSKSPLYVKIGEDYRLLDNSYAIVRDDNLVKLGLFSEQYQPVQPKQITDFFENFILSDTRFKLDTMGSIKGGRVIWTLAKFCESPEIIGAKHDLHALLSTSYDGSMSTRGGACATRAVCQNTIQAAAYEGSIVSIRHNVQFDQVAQDKALVAMQTIAEGFDQYKEFAEALYKIKLTRDQTLAMLGEIVAGVKPEEKVEDMPGRRKNILASLMDTLDVTLGEPGTNEYTAWTGLNTVTRYIDHQRRAVRSVKGETVTDARLASAQFGTGAQIKQRAAKAFLAAA